MDWVSYQESLELGIRDFNQGRAWEAHHHWERHWRELSGAEKAHLQAMILVCGVIYHLERGHAGPALALGKLALQRLAESQNSTGLKVTIPDAATVLQTVCVNLEADLAGASAPSLQNLQQLKAKLVPAA